MNWAWASSLDQIWRSPAFPMWLTLAAAGFFGIIVLITLLRAEKSVANGALTVITLLAIGVAVAGTIRGFGPGGGGASGETASVQTINVSLPALSCVDDLAGETVLAACEKSLFASAASVAVATSYVAARLALLSDIVAYVKRGGGNIDSTLLPMRRAVEADRYGFLAHALAVRDGCTSESCKALGSLSDASHIRDNLSAATFDDYLNRYLTVWNQPAEVRAMYADGRWTPEEIAARLDGSIGQEKMGLIERLEQMRQAAASGDKPNA